MAQQLLDWTFAEIPTDDAPEAVAIVTKIHAPARPPRAKAQPASRRRMRLSSRGKVALVLAGLTAALGVMVLGVGQAGWRRIEQQVTQAALYEENQARAGQVDAVLAAQVPTDGAWLAQRKQEVLLGQPGPNPAPQLHLAPVPAEVTRLTATFANEVQATVVRTYTDASGRQYRFEYTQTYNSQQSGTWLRQPTDTAPLEAANNWDAPRLAVHYRLADQAWLSDTLPAMEAALETACADQNCPANWYVPLVFDTRLPISSSATTEIVLLSPHLSGWPSDEAAGQALREAITARALIFLAGQAAPGDRDEQARWLAGAEAALGQPEELVEAVQAIQ